MTYTLIYYKESESYYDTYECSTFDLAEFENKDGLIEHWVCELIDWAREIKDFTLLINGTKYKFEQERQEIGRQVEIKRIEIIAQREAAKKRESEEYAASSAKINAKWAKEEEKRKIAEARKLLEEKGFKITK